MLATNPVCVVPLCLRRCIAAFTATQLEVLATEVLDVQGVFTDYTDTDGLWRTVKDSGDTIDMTVWTRYI